MKTKIRACQTEATSLQPFSVDVDLPISELFINMKNLLSECFLNTFYNKPCLHCDRWSDWEFCVKIFTFLITVKFWNCAYSYFFFKGGSGWFLTDILRYTSVTDYRKRLQLSSFAVNFMYDVFKCPKHSGG